MRVLIIKTSSLGDVLHTLPAVSDAAAVYPHIQFDWVVEEAFQAIPKLHPYVNQVIPVALRRWRKEKYKALFQGEIKQFLKTLKQTQYDVIIDAQGLLKSAILSCFASGKRIGFARHSAKEPLSSLFYHRGIQTKEGLHAIDKIRFLFSAIFEYPFQNSKPNYGLTIPKQNENPQEKKPYYVFLHGTTWETKQWPEQHWIKLGNCIENAGYDIKLLFGNTIEEARANRIREAVPSSEVLPKMNLEEIALILEQAKGVISVDTGLAHLAAALNVPTLALYGPTNPLLTGTMGENQQHLKADYPCSPCFKKACPLIKEKNSPSPCLASLTPEFVWNYLNAV